MHQMFIRHPILCCGPSWSWTHFCWLLHKEQESFDRCDLANMPSKQLSHSWHKLFDGVRYYSKHETMYWGHMWPQYSAGRALALSQYFTQCLILLDVFWCKYNKLITQHSLCECCVTSSQYFTQCWILLWSMMWVISLKFNTNKHSLHECLFVSACLSAVFDEVNLISKYIFI